ncbi:sugar MFS transporter [Beijerinckia indica]|uniref:Glucose/galactose transporter n=1 Tax=Beijerinckia indica subsp. indica (strain ATCC 9039 / DSM 1715 / NCIMB 8712) TaxID=395963 RepID=B2IDR9_BEII9|nr:sugar MFS transporter [Beijerinckia indica]ACB96851.1 glucose/galactose transporter [Beijerinckia indica subsp. indica ATCC 9039]
MQPSSIAATETQTPVQAPELRIFVFALFFIFGAITSLNDVLIPKLKELFALNYAEAMLTQSAFFTAYFVISMPSGLLVRKIGYLRAATIGLLAMMIGCLLFIPASLAATFGMFLAALFIVASGITVVQVVANPLISILGDPSTAHSRLTFAQAFNSLGTTVAPYIGARIILGSLATVDPESLSGAALDAFRAVETHKIVQTYLGIAAALGIVASIVWANRNRLKEAPAEHVSFLSALSLLKRPRFAFGTLSIFLYVGAEVAIGSILVSYLMQSNTLGFDAKTAGEHVSFYWGGAMIGRFIGAGLLRVFSPGKVLATAASTVMLLLFISANMSGSVSGWALILVGLFNSIMFPTIFSLASEGLGQRAPEGSGLICMAIVGGAIVPPLTGAFADTVGLGGALIVPAICYAGIAGFGWFARHSAAKDMEAA